ncbi:MAG: TonB-dependent receptor, partial [Acidobacteriota bacterium]
LFSTGSEFYVQDHFKVSRKLTLDLGVRYEYMPPFVEWHNRYATFVVDPSLAGYGTLIPAKDGSIEERSLQRPDRNNFSPRLGLAWQATANTVIRAGYGIFYDSTAQGTFSDLPAGNPPFYLDTQIATGNTSATSSVIVKNGFAADALKPEVLAGRAVFNQFPYDFPDALTQQWNLNMQRALPKNMVVSAAYIGSNTVHRRWSAIDLNQPSPGSTAINSRRLFPNQSTITTSLPEGRGNYQALELKLERRFAGGFSTLNGYTWSHAMITDSGPNTRVMQRERGLSPEDMRQRFFSTIIWDIPVGKGRRWVSNGTVSQIIGGWQFSTLFVAQAGLPYTPGQSANTMNWTGANRPNRIGDGNLASGERTPDRWFDKAAFATATPFILGNSGSNIIWAPGVVNLDTTLSRTFQLTERFKLDFRSEFFNVLNEAHLAAPNMTVDVANGGAISSTDTPGRQIQFGMKLIF